MSGPRQTTISRSNTNWPLNDGRAVRQLPCVPVKHDDQVIFETKDRGKAREAVKLSRAPFPEPCHASFAWHQAQEVTHKSGLPHESCPCASSRSTLMPTKGGHGASRSQGGIEPLGDTGSTERRQRAACSSFRPSPLSRSVSSFLTDCTLTCHVHDSFKNHEWVMKTCTWEQCVCVITYRYIDIDIDIDIDIIDSIGRYHLGPLGMYLYTYIGSQHYFKGRSPTLAGARPATPSEFAIKAGGCIPVTLGKYMYESSLTWVWCICCWNWIMFLWIFWLNALNLALWI